MSDLSWVEMILVGQWAFGLIGLVGLVVLCAYWYLFRGKDDG